MPVKLKLKACLAISLGRSWTMQNVRSALVLMKPQLTSCLGARLRPPSGQRSTSPCQERWQWHSYVTWDHPPMCRRNTTLPSCYCAVGSFGNAVTTSSSDPSKTRCKQSWGPPVKTLDFGDAACRLIIDTLVCLGVLSLNRQCNTDENCKTLCILMGQSGPE